MGGEWQLDCQVFSAKFFVFENFFGGAVEYDAAGVKNDSAVSQLQGAHSVLLNDHSRDTLFFDDAKCFFDLINDNRRKPFIGFVKEKNLDVAGK